MTAEEFMANTEARKRDVEEWQEEQYREIEYNKQGPPVSDELSDLIEQNPIE